jgi:hypothetical protein
MPLGKQAEGMPPQTPGRRQKSAHLPGRNEELMVGFAQIKWQMLDWMMQVGMPIPTGIFG